jgi:NADH-ubiquinone oxidoreductase chain 3
MNTLTFFFLFIPVLVCILLAINPLISANRPDSAKVSPYECGFTPMGTARDKFSVQFFLVAILFLVFDLEVIMLFPLGVTLYQNSVYGFWIVMLFLFVLTVGFVYEWSKGALKYTNGPVKSDRKVTPPRFGLGCNFTARIYLWIFLY